MGLLSSKEDCSPKQKELVLMRGLPGSGKTYLAKKYLKKDDDRKNGVILSTDDYFMNNGEYKFDSSILKDAHIWNQERAEKEMRDNETSPIIIDNTHTRKWEAKPYVKNAVKYGYIVKFIETQTEWAKNIDELVKRDAHNVPKKVLKRMLDQWEDDFTVENILNCQAPWEKEN